MEDEVPGSCVCLEGGLRQLLARRRIASKRPAPVHGMRVASQAAPAQTRHIALPELSPEMFLSSGALREMHAAQGMAVRRPQVRVDSRASTTSRDDEIQLDGEIDLGGSSMELYGDLTEIWRDTVASDIGEGFSVEKSTENMDLPVAPIRGPLGDPRGSRFRVDRPPPTPEPFQRETIGGAMREIGMARGQRILSDSRGITVRDLPGDRAYTPIREVIDYNMNNSGNSRRNPVPARVANAREEAQRAVEHARRPTSFDVLRGPDPFDNDDF